MMGSLHIIHKMKILIVGASPILPTGMAEVIRLIFETLLDRYPGEYELHHLGLFHSHTVTTPKWPVYPTRGGRDKDGQLFFLIEDSEGQRTFRELLPKIQPDIVFAHNDPQRVLHLCLEPGQRSYKLILYLNFDGLPFPPDHGPLLARSDLIVTMSEFSKRVVLTCLPMVSASKVDYMYSPADVVRFRPVSENEKLELRIRILPKWIPHDAFLVGWIGRNQWRKQVWLLYSVIHHVRAGGYLVCHDCGRVSLPLPKPLPSRRADELDEDTESQGDAQRAVCGHCRSTGIEKAAPFSDVFL
jgi:hypothetical protein